ncbi:MAG: DNA cytosine methyltransferase, partial [bacterium]
MGMNRTSVRHSSQEAIEAFLRRQRRPRRGGLPALSLFSGGGLSDFGYGYAGFHFLVHAEKDPHRAALCRANSPSSEVIVGDVRKKWKKVVQQYQRACADRPALLSVTPPCQGMSSSNPSRGKVCEPDKKGRNERNLLLLSAIPVIEALNPKCVVVENVPQVLIRMAEVSADDGPKKLVDAFFERLSGYEMFCGVVQMADYGIPQVRRRSVMVLLDKGLDVVEKVKSSGLLPWPKPTHAEAPSDGQQPWLTLKKWLKQRRY